MADFNITDPEIIKMLKGLTEEGRQGVADQLQESLDSGEVKKIIEDTKGNHSTTSEDSLVQELKKENIKLRSLCRRAAEEIRDLDDMIIKSIEDNKVIEYPEEDKTDSAGFSSINLLNRLDGITNGGYVENYDDLNLEMKALNNKHSSDCKWHKDWHACDCGMFDKEEEYIPLRSLYEQVISRINKLDDDTREAKGHLNILVLDRFLADITKLVGE